MNEEIRKELLERYDSSNQTPEQVVREYLAEREQRENTEGEKTLKHIGILIAILFVLLICLPSVLVALGG